MKNNGLKLIAIGLALSYDDRKKKISIMNDMIDSCADSIRSSSDLDGMPHGTTVGDPVSARLQKIEKIEEERDMEQKRVDAVDWAMECALDLVDEEVALQLQNAIMLACMGRKYTNQALLIVEEADIQQGTFYRAKSIFISQILRYLRLGTN